MAGESEFIQEVGAKIIFTQDDYGLAQLGYKHEFSRGLRLFENWYVAADGRLRWKLIICRGATLNVGWEIFRR